MLPKKPTTAMVFGAGLGKRMQPLTNDKPKPLVKVCGKPIIEYTLDKLKEYGIEKVVVNTHYLPDCMEKYLKSYKGLNIHSIHEPILLDTGGGLLQATTLLGNDPFFVINGDIIWMDKPGTSLLDDMANFWQKDSRAVLVLQKTSKAIGYDGNGDFDLTKNNEILVKVAKKKPYVFTGIHLFDPGLFKNRNLEPFSLIDVYREHMNSDGVIKNIHGMVMNNATWFHIGTPAGVVTSEEIISGMHNKVLSYN